MRPGRVGQDRRPHLVIDRNLLPYLGHGRCRLAARWQPTLNQMTIGAGPPTGMRHGRSGNDGGNTLDQHLLQACRRRGHQLQHRRIQRRLGWLRHAPQNLSLDLRCGVPQPQHRTRLVPRTVAQQPDTENNHQDKGARNGPYRGRKGVENAHYHLTATCWTRVQNPHRCATDRYAHPCGSTWHRSGAPDHSSRR